MLYVIYVICYMLYMLYVIYIYPYREHAYYSESSRVTAINIMYEDTTANVITPPVETM